MPLGLPTPMFLVFAATVLAGSLGAIHYLIYHVVLGRPFAEVPPPTVRSGGGPATGDEAGPPGAADQAEGPDPHRGGSADGRG